MILGAYPRSFIDHHFTSDIRALDEFLESTMNPSVGVHILPFWISEGDGGFAVSSWQNMDPQYGTFGDIKLLAKHRKVIIDGIYNHVGWNHPIAEKFLQNPDSNADLIHMTDAIKPPAMPLSPRGGSVYRTHQFGNRIYQIWQTFGAGLLDINLLNDDVMQQVHENLQLLATIGAYGVRLDALPYYGKNSSQSPLHNPDGIEAARLIIEYSRSLGLDPILQVDCDQAFEHYKSLEQFDPAVIDFSFDTYLINAILVQDVSMLRKHLETTRDCVGVRIHRPIRTHDGVLFRSGNQSEAFVANVVELFRKFEFQLRFTNGTPYEANNSLPYLLGAQDSPGDYYKKILLATVVGVLTSNATYIYLNSLLCDMPETNREFSKDPRELQRRPVSLVTLQDMPFAQAEEERRQINKLADLSMEADVRGLPRTNYVVRDLNGVLEIINTPLGFGASLNFTSKTAKHTVKNQSILSSGCFGDRIQPYGFNLYKLN